MEAYDAWCWTGGTGPEALELQRKDMPEPEAASVLVWNEMIGLNPVDWKVLPADGWRSGKVPGVDGAGRVLAVGPGVPQSWVGERVAYHTSLAADGSFAEVTQVPVRALMRLPEELDFEAAAAFPCPGLTAWQALSKVPLRAGAEILVSGAGGSVGAFVVQLAREAGYRVTTLANPRHDIRLIDLGAAECLPGDAIPPEGRFHAIIDTTGPERAAALAPCLKANGHLVCVLGRVEGWLNEPFAETRSLHEVALGALHQHGDDDDWAELVNAGEDMLRKLANGRLAKEAVVIAPFSQLDIHLAGLRKRNFTGKALIDAGARR